ncbi:MAG: hypothetical protein RLY43_103 [Bacteroidota bacterium]|jgi:hypothetical protein
MNKKSHKKSNHKSSKTVQNEEQLDHVSKEVADINDGTFFAESLKNKLDASSHKRCFDLTNDISRAIMEEGDIENQIKERGNKRSIMSEEERLVILDRAQRLGANNVESYLKKYDMTIEDLNKPIDNSIVEELVNKSDINEAFVKKIIEESDKETLLIMERKDLNEKGLRVHSRQIASDEREKNPMIERKDGIIKVKRPFFVTPFNKSIKEVGKSKRVDFDSARGISIRENYGQDNYINSISTFNDEYRANYPQIELGIPDINVKIMETESQEAADSIKAGREHYEKNKNEMQQQMNVVAFYSIKDAKPFYYVSSAEARLAIEHINLCRKYKKDVFKINADTISKYVNNISSIVKQIKDNNQDINAISTIWENNLNNMECNSTFSQNIESYTNVKNITKQVFLSKKIDGVTIGLQKFRITIDDINSASINKIMNLHESLLLLGQCSHYIISNNWYVDLLTTKSLLEASNMTEKEIFGIVGKYNKKPVFINENLAKNVYLILARRIDNGEIVISEYEIEKAILKTDENGRSEIND